MANAKCPEPKPVTIALLTAAGALGGTAAAVIGDYAVRNMIRSSLVIQGGALMGAALGVSMGVPLALSSSLWKRAIFATLFGGVSMVASIKLCTFLIGIDNPFKSMASDHIDPRMKCLFAHIPTPLLADIDTSFTWAVFVGAPAALGLVLAHHVHWGGKWLPVAAINYLAIGALSFSLFWHDLVWNPSAYRVLDFTPLLINGWIIGAAFGALQFAGLLAALALDRKMSPRLDPPPAAPVPEPGP